MLSTRTCDMTVKDSRRAIAQRLEQVRESNGLSLREFRGRALTATGEDFSYSSARNYHTDDVVKGRVPSVGYLDAVSRAFGVRLGWLIRGEGAMRESKGYTLVDARMEKLERVCPDWPESAKDNLIGLLRYQVGVEDPVLPMMEEDLITLLMLPLEAWGFQSITELSGPDRLAYFGAFFSALFVAAKGHAQGARLGEYPDSKLARLRRLMSEPDPGPSEEVRQQFDQRQVLIEALSGVHS